MNVCNDNEYRTKVPETSTVPEPVTEISPLVPELRKKTVQPKDLDVSILDIADESDLEGYLLDHAPPYSS